MYQGKKNSANIENEHEESILSNVVPKLNNMQSDIISSLKDQIINLNDLNFSLKENNCLSAKLYIEIGENNKLLEEQIARLEDKLNGTNQQNSFAEVLKGNACRMIENILTIKITAKPGENYDKPYAQVINVVHKTKQIPIVYLFIFLFRPT